jgi:exodeoxyribonuclease-5
MGVVSVSLKDEPARRSAIADHGFSALVEAGAGSGKTAIMAGRVAMMLADGVAPKSIAAVTFTELAAAELLSRVREFVAKLLDAKVPTEMKCCLPAGLTPLQRDNLAAAATSIDEIACTTIHGFCQRLIKPYPAEANIDPGARVADRGQADLLFDEVKDAWLRERLSRAGQSLLAEMVAADVDQAMDAVGTILGCLRKHPDIGAPDAATLSPLVDAYVSAVALYGDFIKNCRIKEQESIDWAGHFRVHVGALPAAPHDSPAAVVRLLRARHNDELLTTTGGFYAFRKKGKWEAAGKSAGVAKAQAGMQHDEARDHYDRCCDGWKALRSALGANVLGMLVAELRPAVERFQSQKRAVGLLDFDDLIRSALKLLREHDAVRKALAQRYTRVLVDEFQDTDPHQAEIFWRLCGDPKEGADPSDWRSFAIRPGSLFLVGDPKQAIYRFRGADVAAYVEARKAFDAAGATKAISTNFRSRPKVLDFVNARFCGALSADGQPGFAELDPFHKDHDGHCGVVALDIDVGGPDPQPNVNERREAEAEAVADMCERLIGNARVRDQETGEMRPCRAGDIALLAPTGTDLWRYEAALEERGIAVATQAGKGLFKQQEIQDLIALTRTLADGRDTLALGAFLRGPLVGLTEEQLLDIVWALPKNPERPDSLPSLSLSIEPDRIADPYARDVFRKLRFLRNMAVSTTPHALVSQAVDAFNVRAMLVRRHTRQAERALANVDLFLEMSKPYAVRGLRSFAEAMTGSWSAAYSEGGKVVEGRVDVQEEAVSVYTMHASKGLEWPIVAPINTMGPPMAVSTEVVDRANARLYAPVFGLKPDGYDDAHAAEKAEVERERIRLWYVTATRAKELLVLPRHSVPVTKNAWGALVDLALDALPALDLSALTPVGVAGAAAFANPQDAAVFADEAGTVVKAHRALTWSRPSLAEGSEDADEPAPRPIVVAPVDGEGAASSPPLTKGGHIRGLVMHKLFEEVLNGETADAADVLAARAAELLRQLGLEPSADPATEFSSDEIAGAVVRSLALPQIVALRPTLTPEMPVYAFEEGEEGEDADVATGGVADAISYGAAGGPEVVVDWKSDVNPASGVLKHYQEQVRAYLSATGAQRGLIVLATKGAVIEVRSK